MLWKLEVSNLIWLSTLNLLLFHLIFLTKTFNLIKLNFLLNFTILWALLMWILSSFHSSQSIYSIIIILLINWAFHNNGTEDMCISKLLNIMNMIIWIIIIVCSKTKCKYLYYFVFPNKSCITSVSINSCRVFPPQHELKSFQNFSSGTRG